MSRKSHVRLFGFAVLVLVGLVLVIACAAPPAPTATVEQINWSLNEAPEELEAFQKVVNKFQTANPNIQVNVINIPDDEEFNKRLAADVAAGTPPDVFTINYRFIGPYAIKGALAPMDAYLNASQTIKPTDYFPTALNAFKFKGQQYCMPLNLSSLQVYYNKKMFEEANVALPKNDWTWANFVAAAKALTKDTNNDGKPDQYGAGISTSVIRLASFVWAHGGEIVDNNERPTMLTIDSGAALEAFQWFVDLQVKEKVVPNKEAEATQSSQARFQAGTLAMFFQSRVITPELRETIKNFEWDVAPLPQDKMRATVLHSDGFCMTSASKHKDATWKFVEYITGPVGQQVLAETGRTVPALMSVANSPAFLKSNPPASNQVYLDMAPFVRPVPLMTTWSEVEGAFGKEIKRAFYGDATVAEAAKAAVAGTKEFFKQNLTDLGSP